MYSAKSNRNNHRMERTICDSRFHKPAFVASCVLGSPKYFGQPKTTCPSLRSGGVSSKVGNAVELKIENGLLLIITKKRK